MSIFSYIRQKMDGTNAIHFKHITLVLAFAIKRFNFK